MATMTVNLSEEEAKEAVRQYVVRRFALVTPGNVESDVEVKFDVVADVFDRPGGGTTTYQVDVSAKIKIGQ